MSGPEEDNIRDRLQASFQELPEFVVLDSLLQPGLFNVISEKFHSNLSENESLLLIDANHSIKKLRQWKQYMPGIKPHFAVKCNPNAVLVRSLVLAGGCGFDCASRGEIDLVLAQGARPSDIVFANPAKPAESIAYALSRGIARMTFDGLSELTKVRGVLDGLEGQHCAPELILRLRVPDEHSSSPLGPKFGVVLLQVEEMLRGAVTLSLRVVGVSFHCGSGCYDARAYTAALEIAKHAFDTAETLGLHLALVDLGGGYPGLGSVRELPRYVDCSCPTPLALEEIAALVLPVLSRDFTSRGVEVIAEPGRYFVEGALALYLQVFDFKRVRRGGLDSTAWMVNEGTMGCFKDIVLNDEPFEPELVDAKEGLGCVKCRRQKFLLTERGEKHILMGCEGSKTSVLHEDLPFVPEVGDWVKYSRFGAYTSSIASFHHSTAIKNVIYVWCTKLEMN